MAAIGSEVDLPAPNPDGPNMFRCAAPGAVDDRFRRAGLVDIGSRDVEVDLVTRSAAEYWAVMSEHVSLAVAALQSVDEPARERIRLQSLVTKCAKCVGNECGREGQYHDVVYKVGEKQLDARATRQMEIQGRPTYIAARCKVDPRSEGTRLNSSH